MKVDDLWMLRSSRESCGRAAVSMKVGFLDHIIKVLLYELISTGFNKHSSNPCFLGGIGKRTISSRPVWATDRVPGYPGYPSETLSQDKV